MRPRAAQRTERRRYPEPQNAKAIITNFVEDRESSPAYVIYHLIRRQVLGIRAWHVM